MKRRDVDVVDERATKKQRVVEPLLIVDDDRGPYYAVRVGRKPGVYKSWADCYIQVHGHKGAAFKKFNTAKEANAFVNSETALSFVVQKDVKTIDKDANSTSSNERTIVYTDGACKGNGTSKAIAGIGVWFGRNDERNVCEKLEGSKQTNQRAELTAGLVALRHVKRYLSTSVDAAIEIRTDSKYLIGGMTEWMANWKRRDWNVNVVNKDIWLKLDEATTGLNVKWTYVKAHSGIEGNEGADALANAGCNL